MSKGLALVGLLCLGGCSCQGDKTVKRDTKKAPALKKGVTPIETPVSGPQTSQPMAAAKPLHLVVRAWHPKQAEAEKQLRELLAQTKAGYTFAVTGDGRVLLKPLPAAEIAPSKPKPGLGFNGIKTVVSAAEREEVGGAAALVTASLPWRGGALISARSLLEAGLSQLAKQSGGSGRIYPLRLGEPRIDQGQIRAEVTARVLKDGASGLP